MSISKLKIKRKKINKKKKALQNEKERKKVFTSDKIACI